MTPQDLSTASETLALTAIQAERQLPDVDFCRSVRFELSASSWGKIKAGTYSGNIDRAMDAIRRSLAVDHTGSSTEATIDGTVLLDHILDTQSAVEIARRANDEHRLVILCGTYGSGKSTTARHLIRSYGGNLIHAKPSWSSSYLELLSSLASGIGLTGGFRSAGSAERAILTELSSAPRLIVIDEANHFSASGLNFLKTILNETRSAIVLCTLPAHLAQIAAVHREESRQLVRRAISIIHIAPVTASEVAALRDHLHPDLPTNIPLGAVASASNRYHRMDTATRILREIDPADTDPIPPAIARVERMIRISPGNN